MLPAFINNTPVVVVFMPIMISLAASRGLKPSRLLIPLSFASILGVLCTLIGTSTNILVSSTAQQLGQPPLSIFELGRAGCLRGLGRLPEALAAFDAAVALKPDHAMAIDLRGRVKQQMNDFAGALADYEKALELSPGEADTMNQLAWIVNRGSTKPMIHVIPRRKQILTIMANASPVLRACRRNSSGSLLETMEIKITLSMPSTISRKQRVRRASQASAFRNISIR